MAKLNHILPTYVWEGGRCLRRVVFSTEINFNFRNILCNLKEERSVNWVWVVNDIRVVNRMCIRNRVWVGVGADDFAGFDLSNVKCAGIKNWRTFYQRCWTKVFMAAVVLGAQQRKGWQGVGGVKGDDCAWDWGWNWSWYWVWHAAKMKECDLFSHWQSFDFARARFSTADFTLWLEGGTPKGVASGRGSSRTKVVGGGSWYGGVDWLLVALVAFIELAISLPFELLLPLVVAYLLAAFGRVFFVLLSFYTTPPPLSASLSAFLFFICQISAHAVPSLVSLKKDTKRAVVAVSRLFSVSSFSARS